MRRICKAITLIAAGVATVTLLWALFIAPDLLKIVGGFALLIAIVGAVLWANEVDAEEIFPTSADWGGEAPR